MCIPCIPQRTVLLGTAAPPLPFGVPVLLLVSAWCWLWSGVLLAWPASLLAPAAGNRRFRWLKSNARVAGGAGGNLTRETEASGSSAAACAGAAGGCRVVMCGCMAAAKRPAACPAATHHYHDMGHNHCGAVCNLPTPTAPGKSGMWSLGHTLSILQAATQSCQRVRLQEQPGTIPVADAHPTAHPRIKALHATTAHPPAQLQGGRTLRGDLRGEKKTPGIAWGSQYLAAGTAQACVEALEDAADYCTSDSVCSVIYSHPQAGACPRPKVSTASDSPGTP